MDFIAFLRELADFMVFFMERIGFIRGFLVESALIGGVEDHVILGSRALAHLALVLDLPSSRISLHFSMIFPFISDRYPYSNQCPLIPRGHQSCKPETRANPSTRVVL